ncbi:hypothetical protein WJX72_006948 [[Myrmecia] bisecta]|uniref:DPH-type MB domain-containing protein n=1 Tax=[Myrmecia] bisecta TaxID=41462 RepID=A0AAW1Q9B6_9CHLO
MALPKPGWRVYAGGALLIWAVGLQVHMWQLTKKPEFQEKFGDATSTAEQNKLTVRLKEAEFQRVQAAWQVLKDPATRQAYDDELVAAKLKQECAISDEIDLDDMAIETPSEGASLHSYSCRCGGHYFVSDEELHAASDHVVVQCDTCSLFIRIMYSVRRH